MLHITGKHVLVFTRPTEVYQKAWTSTHDVSLIREANRYRLYRMLTCMHILNEQVSNFFSKSFITNDNITAWLAPMI